MTTALLIWAVAAPVNAADQIKWYSHEEGMALGASESKKSLHQFSCGLVQISVRPWTVRPFRMPASSLI